MPQDKKRYYFSCVGEALLNPEYHTVNGVQYGQIRVEIFDREASSEYQVEEVTFRLPHEMIDALYEVLDFKEMDTFTLGNIVGGKDGIRRY